MASAFGNRLRELREQGGFTQAQLAQQAGLHPQGIVKLERGEREPAWATVVALATALKVDCRAFLVEAEAGYEPRQGRPRKPTPSPVPTDTKPRGRPARATPATPPAAEREATAKKPARQPKKKR